MGDIEFGKSHEEKQRELQRILQRRRHRDITALSGTHEVDGRAAPDPNYRYKWVNKKARSVASAQGQGFEKVDPASVDTIADYGIVKDGAIQLGEGSDLILMRERLETYEGKRAADAEQQRDRINGVNEAAKERLNKLARDEGRVAAHRNVVDDMSADGQPVTMRVNQSSGKPRSR